MRSKRAPRYQFEPAVVGSGHALAPQARPAHYRKAPVAARVPSGFEFHVASRSHKGDELESWLERAAARFPQMELVSMGSSLKICLVAEGRADIYPRLALTSEWDTAAAQAVLEAAGGVLTDTDFNIYRYNQKEDILNPFFFAIGDRTFDWKSL